MMDSLEALSSSGPDSAPETGVIGGGDAGGEGKDAGRLDGDGESKDDYRSLAVLDKKNKSKKSYKKATLPAQAASNKPLKVGGGGGEVDRAPQSKVASERGSDDTDPATEVSGSGCSGSGSSSGLGGFGTVSAPTTVVRLAGSPNPPLKRDGVGLSTGSARGRGAGGGGGSGGGSASENADAGLRRLAPNGGGAGVAERGRAKSRGVPE